MNHTFGKDIPRFDVHLFFDEIGVLLDRDQYSDAISLVDMYQVYARQHQVSCTNITFISAIKRFYSIARSGLLMMNFAKIVPKLS